MKIIVVQDYLRSGGTERQSLRLARAFHEAGHATTLITFRPGGALEVGETPRLALQPFDLGLDWFAPGLSAAARRLAPDIVLCMGRMANCYAGRLQKALPAAAVVATLRTGKPLPWLFRRSLLRVRHVIANSREARQNLLAWYGMPPGLVSVIPNPLLFPPVARDAAVRARFWASESTTVLLSVAMFRPEKNQRELVEIVAGMPAELDWQLWLAGDGPARASCERLARARGLKDRVKFLGLWPDPRPLYAAADVAVHASWSESHSNFLSEAQAHGLPAVASTAQGIRECFIPGETGWEGPAGDRAGFIAALARLIAEPPELRAARSKKAAAFALQAFDPARQTRAHLELFESLVRVART